MKVILMPRHWQISRSLAGLAISITARYTSDGSLFMNWFTLWPLLIRPKIRTDAED